MTARRWVGGAVLLWLLPLVGCVEEGPRTQTSPSATTSPVTSEPPAGEEEPPTGEELASEEATAVFEEMLRVTDAASRDPGMRDWEPEIRRYAADPAAFLAVMSVRDLGTLGLRQEGNSKVDVEVAAVDLEAPEGPTVELTGCYDSQSTQVVNVETGQVVPPGTPPRYVWDITVIKYVAEPGQPWLVSTLEPMADQPC